MITFEEVGEMLDEIALEIPQEVYRELNGGINLLPGEKFHPQSDNLTVDLYIMGEYYNEPYGLGRYIAIYYGSFIRLYAHSAPEQQKERLREVLHHEFIHHLESLAGENDLTVQDARDIADYKRKWGIK